MIISDNELENGFKLVDQDSPAKHTDECFNVPSTNSLFNGSIISDYPNSPENSDFYLAIDASLGSSQNSLMSKQKSTQTLDSVETSHSYICTSRDDHDLDTSIDSSKSGMLYCSYKFSASSRRSVITFKLFYSCN